MTGKDGTNPLLTPEEREAWGRAPSDSAGSTSLLPLRRPRLETILRFCFSSQKPSSDTNAAGREWVYFSAILIQISTYFRPQFLAKKKTSGLVAASRPLPESQVLKD